MATIAPYIAPASGDSLVPTGRFDGVTHSLSRTSYLNVIAIDADGTSHPTVIDSLSNSKQLNLTGSASKIRFIGLRTEGAINLDGQDIDCWYGDHSHPGVNRSNPGAWNSTFNSPDAMFMRGAQRITHWGCKFHDCADFADIGGGREVALVGCWIYNLYASYEGPAFPAGSWHTDAPDSNVNSAKSHTTTWEMIDCFIDCSLNGVGRVGAGPQIQATLGSVDALMRRVWIKNSTGTVIEMSAGAGKTCRLELDQVKAWGWGPNPDPIVGETRPRCTLIGSLDLSVGVGSDPSAVWRAAHPFATWRTFFGETNLTVPSEPRSPQAAAGDATATLTWQAPSNSGGVPITGYRASRSPGSGANDILLTSSARSATFTGLSNGTPYALSVVAINSVGESDPATAGSVTPIAASVPGAPVITDVAATTDNSGHMGLVWTPPATGGAPIDHYRVTSSPSTGNWDFPGDSIGGFITGAVGTGYTLQVKAHNSAGYGSNSAASASITPTSGTQPLWRDSIDMTPAAWSYWSPAEQVAQLDAWLDDVGNGARFDLGIEAFRGNNATADAALDRIEAAGHDSMLVIVTYFGAGGARYPDLSQEAVYRAAFAAMATRYLGRYPAMERRYELINEANNTTRLANGQPDVVMYAILWRWFFEEVTAADPDAICVTTGPAHLITNKPPSVVGSNVYGSSYNSGAGRSWSETDWIADHCNPAVVGVGNDLGTVGCHRVGMHTYVVEQGPLALFGTPVGQNGSGALVNSMRQLTRVDTILTAAGIDALIDITEMGFCTAPSYVAGVSRAKGTILFPSQGTPNGADFWNRPQVYIATAQTNTQPGAGGAPWLPYTLGPPGSHWSASLGSVAANRLVWHNGHTWRATVAHTSSAANAPGAGGAPWDDLGVSYNGTHAANALSTENEAAFHWRNVLRIWFGVRNDADGRNIAARRYGRIAVFTPWDATEAPRVAGRPGFSHGLRYIDGTDKGQPPGTGSNPSGPWSMFEALANTPDNRRVFVPPVAGGVLEPLLSIPIDA